MEAFETIIIVGVTIAVAIALAYFVSNIISPYTAVELLDISYSIRNNTAVDIFVRNKGISPVVIVALKVDGNYNPIHLNVEPGATATLTVPLGSQGKAHEIKVVSSSGVEYTIIVNL